MRRPLYAFSVLVIALALAVPGAAWAAGIDRAQQSVAAVVVGADIIGSGVVVAEGYVLTAAHVADDVRGHGPRVELGGVGATFTVVATDRTRDLALLRTDTHAVQPVVFGDSGSVRRGQDVTAIGYPIGLRSVTFTRGVVSSPSQVFDGRTFLQTDAAINPGNSGGPLVDAEGRLVGINVEKVSGGGVDTVGFSVPVADALAFVRATAPDAKLEVAPGLDQRSMTTTLLTAAAVLVILTAIYLGTGLLFRRRGGDLSGPVKTPAASLRRTFHVAGPARDDEVTVSLPAVVGSAANADLRVVDPGVAEYQARIGLEALGTVTVTNLLDDDGVFCGDGCVKHAVIAPGMSFRVGQTVVTLVERRG
ncbi:MAG: trypsin-like peptidase domain-containing protein [Coriobacteriia bacterium]|nr:trypsin-like peptidase domain-containing protein [Coriobacteriia bacterium]